MKIFYKEKEAQAVILSIHPDDVPLFWTVLFRDAKKAILIIPLGEKDKDSLTRVLELLPVNQQESIFAQDCRAKLDCDFVLTIR